MVTPRSILDTSALAAFVFGEAGSDKVEAALPGAVSALCYSELAALLLMRGKPARDVRSFIFGLPIDVVSFDVERALAAARLRPMTQHLGLSLADRACLALSIELRLPVFTADRAWLAVKNAGEIRRIR